MSSILICVLFFALVFEFINGFHDTANAIATSVYTRALSAKNAILLAAIMNFCGALVSDKVAKTISKGLVNIQLEQYVILAALIAAIIWNLITWWKGIPSSSSHALIGGLLGATMVYSGSTEPIVWDGVIQKVIIPLFTSPLIGFLVGYLFMRTILTLFVNWSHNKVNKLFLKLQILSAALVAYSHGNNDAQKTMGIMTLALISGGLLDSSAGVPVWIKIACATTMAIGTSIGGWKIMKTMGGSVTKIQPSSGFAAQTAAALVIEFMSHFGAPVSTTQVITTSIMGAGSVKRFSAVKWGVAQSIVVAWVVTLPISMFIGGLVSFLIGMFM
ncbi:inorganic phosphate transporter [Clostridium aminobutyricum]|uniref:Inorganic phosphate transporter n=1 Tax=Clostridium aminobutyricum TaxID=33953 RepID=A0A939IG17_CLOAM|nr:inorganic phosphate transporter [Clostridium aminobutyricum]MBN7772405.1 inorganic phosphate transporter [Clostridium aminobutyricum]